MAGAGGGDEDESADPDQAFTGGPTHNTFLTRDAPGLVEHAIFGEDLVDGRAPTRGVVLTEDVVKIAGQQIRYAVGHGLSPCPFRAPRSATPTRSTSSTRWGRSADDEAAALPLSVRRDDLPDEACLHRHGRDVSSGGSPLHRAGRRAVGGSEQGRVRV